MASVAIVASVACTGAYYNYSVEKQTSLDDMTEEMTEVTKDLSKTKNEIRVEYGLEALDFDSKVAKVHEKHPTFAFTYTVDGKEQSTFSTYEVGTHVVDYSFYKEDKYEQSVSGDKQVTYVVEDTQAPVISLAETEVTVYEGSEYDLSKLVESVSDVVDGELEMIDESTDLSEHTGGYYKIETDYSKGSSVGEYEAKIIAVDCNGLVSEEVATIKVIARPKKEVAQANTTYANSQSYSDPSRIYIGSYTAVLYYAPENQVLVDAADSAIYYSQHGRTVVADHAYQGFTAMLYNDTGMFLGSSIHKVSTHYGTINATETDIYYDDGGSFLGNNDASIVMFTCVSGEGRRVVTYWEYD